MKFEKETDPILTRLMVLIFGSLINFGLLIKSIQFGFWDNQEWYIILLNIVLTLLLFWGIFVAAYFTIQIFKEIKNWVLIQLSELLSFAAFVGGSILILNIFFPETYNSIESYLSNTLTNLV